MTRISFIAEASRASPLQASTPSPSIENKAARPAKKLKRSKFGKVDKYKATLDENHPGNRSQQLQSSPEAIQTTPALSDVVSPSKLIPVSTEAAANDLEASACPSREAETDEPPVHAPVFLATKLGGGTSTSMYMSCEIPESVMKRLRIWNEREKYYE